MADLELSQEQLDALISGSGATAGSGPQPAEIRMLADFEQNALNNIGGVINAMTGFDYSLQSVDANLLKSDEVDALYSDDQIFRAPLTAGSQFAQYFSLEKSFALKIAAALTGHEEDSISELGEMELSAVNEVFATISGSYLNALSQVFSEPVNPGVMESVSLEELRAEAGEDSVSISLTLAQNGNEPVLVRHILDGALSRRLLSAITPEDEPELPPPPQPPRQQAAAAPPVASASSGNLAQPTVQYAPAQFSQFESASAAGLKSRNLDLLLDVPLSITVELGKTSIPIKQILEYGQGSLISLDKLSGEPVDLLVNGRYFAKGEVVIIDENFGVRVTSILSPSERLSQLT